MVIPTQLIAGIASAAVVNGILPGPLGVGNALSNGTRPLQGLFLEMFLTSQLVLTVYFLAVEKHRATFLAPIGVGVSVFITHLAGTNYTATSVNPARSLGPAVFVGFPGYHWIYWLGPTLGSFLAFGLYSVMKALDYSTANPGQDMDSTRKSNVQTQEQSTRASQVSHTSFHSRAPLVESRARHHDPEHGVSSDEETGRHGSADA